MHYNIGLLHKKVTYCVTLLLFWKVMHYNILLLYKKVTCCVTLLLFMESNALQYWVTR